jgi:ADP-ribose pyrophosphatase YjhB (NUDIX family)
MNDDRRYPARPILGVGAVIVIDGLVVLVKRRNPPLEGRWSLPGGVLEVGEPVRAAVAREALEETGLSVTVGDLLEIVEHVDRDADGRVCHHFVILDYRCAATGGAIRAAGDADAAVLVKPDAATMEAYALSDAARRVIRRALDADSEQIQELSNT